MYLFLYFVTAIVTSPCYSKAIKGKGVSRMLEHPWSKEQSRTIICLDSYHNGVPVGRIYSPNAEVIEFNSLSQFLIKTDELLDGSKKPQAFTTPRTFAATEQPATSLSAADYQQGKEATFTLQILFRQHTSWQGVITWVEEQKEQGFRSVMELIFLMDSVLRRTEESRLAS